MYLHFILLAFSPRDIVFMVTIAIYVVGLVVFRTFSKGHVVFRKRRV